MNLTPLVSVIIPCYNAERFLPETLESVFRQTIQDFEVLVIDDGSIDNTANIIRSFGNRLRSEFSANCGASAARNRGTSLSRGMFIQYLDADDLLRPHALEERVNVLMTCSGDVVYSDWQYLNELESGVFQSGDIVNQQLETFHKDPQIAIFTNFWAPPAALLYRRRIVEAIGLWNESLPIIQDARFLLDAALAGGKFVHIPNVQADYRVHKSTTSLSHRSQDSFVQDIFCNALQVEMIWNSSGGITSDRRVALERVYGQVARFYFEHDRSKFYEVLARIHNLNPNYKPSTPRSLRLLSRWIGYEHAEAIALAYRSAKQSIKRKF
jgi:glycosyltransferase involved in cell wall biosynthesis